MNFGILCHQTRGSENNFDFLKSKNTLELFKGRD